MVLKKLSCILANGSKWVGKELLKTSTHTVSAFQGHICYFQTDNKLDLVMKWLLSANSFCLCVNVQQICPEGYRIWHEKAEQRGVLLGEVRMPT